VGIEEMFVVSSLSTVLGSEIAIRICQTFLPRESGQRLNPGGESLLEVSFERIEME
jgi:hypothetical protein